MKLITLSLGTLLCLAACGKSEFHGGRSTQASQVKSSKDGEKKDRKDTSAESAEQDLELPDCPSQSQNILVLDLRSGWWPSMTDQVLVPLHAKCEMVEIEYHHLLGDASSFTQNTELFIPGGDYPASGLTQNVFRQTNWDDYTQIWILSGYAGELPPTGVPFQHILRSAVESSAALFLGGALNHTEHIRDFPAQLGLTGTIANGSTAVGKVELSKENRLLRDVKNLADMANSIQWAGSSLTSLVADPAGNPVLLSGEIDSGRRLIFEGNLQRYTTSYYPSSTTDEGQLLHNIMVWLSGD